MKYMLLIYGNQSEMPDFTPEQRQAMIRAWMNYEREAKAAGVLITNEGLSPVTVRVREGEVWTTDGPFAETHEQLGAIS